MYYPNYPGEGTKITFKTNIKDNEYIVGKVKGEIKKIKKFENLKETFSPILNNWIKYTHAHATTRTKGEY